MSDPGRKDFSTKAKEEIIPDSTKSTQQKAKEAVTDTTDRIARGAQSDESKSAGQEVHDKAQRASDRDNHGGTMLSVGDKIKGTLGIGTKHSYARPGIHNSAPPKKNGQQLASPGAEEVGGEAEEGEDTMEWKVQVNDAMETAELSSRPQAKLRIDRVTVPEFVFPKSAYDGHVRPLETSKERTVLKCFFGEQELRLEDNGRRQRQNTDEFNQIELHSFSIYRPESKNTQSGELAPLHFLCAKSANNDYYFDGILADGSNRRYVEKVPFNVLSIGNYLDTSLHTVGDQIWIQSSYCKGKEIWYQLREPAPEYRDYHEQFLWIAEFTKHFVDFLNDVDKVSLHHFRQRFHDWAHELHGNDADFESWISAYGHTDFRSVVAAHFEFLWKEAIGVQNGLHKHPIWSEVDSKRLAAVKEHRFKTENTIVTPYVYECFKRLPFGGYFNVITPSPKVLASRREREVKLDLTVGDHLAHIADPGAENTRSSSVVSGGVTRSRHTGGFEMLREFFDEKMNQKDDDQQEQDRIETKAKVAREKFIGPVLVTPSRLKRDEYGRLLERKPKTIAGGEVVAVKKDSQTVWKGESDLWFAYVQEVHVTKKGRRFLKVIWLYEPSDTSCSTMHYPIRNELFFSDNCNCGDGVLDAEDVLCKVPVALFSKPGEAGAEYLVRQKYNTSDASFVTLRHSDLRCVHFSKLESSPMEEAKEKYRVGDTVLILKDNILEPVHLVGFATDQVLVRRLPRRGRDYRPLQSGRPNELVWTEDIYLIRPEDIDRKCHIRFYTEDEKTSRKIPAPYNRDGTADAYFITSYEASDGPYCEIKPLSRPFPSMNQGFDPNETPSRPVMNGMDLFCGGGNFGRGLEEGGAVHNKWAVDIGKEQIHTYRANLRKPEDTNLYFGSVNDIIRNGLKGNFSPHVPMPGEVDFISAGSPCQGFSNANNRREEEKGLRNSSLVASVATFVDFYRPKYALLENVAGMASGNRDRNVFSQLLCTLVGMGYQVQQFNLDAWSFGSPQSRSRLFVSIAAPGLKLPPHPALSHSHPPGKGDRGIGTGANGEKYGRRRFEVTPFEYITATEATSDLPFIGQSRSHTCIRYPDHRQSCTKSNPKRILVNCVPVNPRQQSFIRAVNSGRMPKPIVDNYSWGKSGHKRNLIARSWQRVDPNALMPTITTSAQPACAFTGAVVHWDQHRLLTVMEARRAQSFPDDEVLIGIASAQWKIVGNSVARTVALALGMSVREAWLSNDDDAPSHRAQRVMVETGVSPQGTDRTRRPGRINCSFASGRDIGAFGDPAIGREASVASSLASNTHRQASKRKCENSGIVDFDATHKIRKMLHVPDEPHSGSDRSPALSHASRLSGYRDSEEEDTVGVQSSRSGELCKGSVGRASRGFDQKNGKSGRNPKRQRFSGTYSSLRKDTRLTKKWLMTILGIGNLATVLQRASTLIPFIGSFVESGDGPGMASRSMSTSTTSSSQGARAISLSSTSEAPGAPMSISTPPGDSDLETK
ncbi:MAG: DNA methyltransferase Dim-2 [Geoglossum umbratile]|nr:MAG: DNA methyltransferase Dim-2 [Geoglossum umbratile]